MAPDTVHQCPYCELRFAHRPELADHVAADHPQPVDHDVPAVPHPRGVVTVALDPAHPPGPALPVAIALGRQAGLAVEVVSAPATGLPTAAYLDSAHRRVVEAGAAAVPAVELAGEAADAIVAHAAARPSQLLCLATHAWGPLGERLLGSVSARVTRRSPVPVVLAGPALADPGRPIRRVLAGIDGSPLARQALDVAAEVAGWLGVGFDIAYVIRPDDPYSQVPDAALLWAEAHLRPAWDYGVLRDDDPSRGLVEAAGSAGDTLLVVGSHGRTGLALAVLGSVSAGVVRHATGPVLVVPATAARPLGPATPTATVLGAE